MSKTLVFLSNFAVLCLLAGPSRTLLAQQPAFDGQTSQPAPIVRAYATGQLPGRYDGANGMRTPPSPLTPQIMDSRPVAGVWLRTDSGSIMTTVSADSKKAQFRLEHGRLNVTVHAPENHTEILVDLPGGEIALLKDGLYTFNADTNTVRVLRGEAAAYPGTPNSATANADRKPVKIKTDRQLAFMATPATLKSVEAYPFELTADLLPPNSQGRYADGGYEDQGYEAGYGERFEPYGYTYEAGAWGYPWAWGYPYGYSIGFGYYGGFGRGFGGFGRGFRR